MSKIFEITDIQQYNDLLSSYKYVVLDIYAEWCQPCKMLAPKLQELADIYSSSDVVFAKCDAQTGLVRPQSLPTVQLFVNGQLIHTVVGFDMPKINELIGMIASKPSGPTPLPSQQLQPRQPERPPQYHNKNSNSGKQYKTYKDY